MYNFNLFLFFLSFIFIFFPFIFTSWRLITLQCYSGFLILIYFWTFHRFPLNSVLNTCFCRCLFFFLVRQLENIECSYLFFIDKCMKLNVCTFIWLYFRNWGTDSTYILLCEWPPNAVLTVFFFVSLLYHCQVFSEIIAVLI